MQQQKYGRKNRDSLGFSDKMTKKVDKNSPRFLLCIQQQGYHISTPLRKNQPLIFSLKNAILHVFCRTACYIVNISIFIRKYEYLLFSFYNHLLRMHVMYV